MATNIDINHRIVQSLEKNNSNKSENPPTFLPENKIVGSKSYDRLLIKYKTAETKIFKPRRIQVEYEDHCISNKSRHWRNRRTYETE
ncbi:hypothetical protein NARC_60024 [Candidatus Nitrosocosmicus arcticus]|uniref:Uncharacterized protein n=1 Tax=Candidatus Nitrosocosmicus arcticus TaxID=2035267 RepID=A0A557SVK2_9ARCH|nr:hypothetical protein NARC_60024 [Candidatus Nitrosocosmicus arcticus]